VLRDAGAGALQLARGEGQPRNRAAVPPHAEHGVAEAAAGAGAGDQERRWKQRKIRKLLKYLPGDEAPRGARRAWPGPGTSSSTFPTQPSAPA
jgi:hypothetical protein